VGAGSCGSCYWLLAAENADLIEVGGNMGHMKWSGYAGRQTSGHAGETPLKLFYKNYCSTAMHSLDTTTEISACNGVRFVDEAENGRLAPVASIAPKPNLEKPNADTYYPHVYGTRAPSVCDPTKKDTDPGGCSVQSAPRCANGDARNCATYVIDHYTTSFNWAETNFSAIWLRNPGWFV